MSPPSAHVSPCLLPIFTLALTYTVGTLHPEDSSQIPLVKARFRSFLFKLFSTAMVNSMCELDWL